MKTFQSSRGEWRAITNRSLGESRLLLGYEVTVLANNLCFCNSLRRSRDWLGISSTTASRSAKPTHQPT